MTYGTYFCPNGACNMKKNKSFIFALSVLLILVISMLPAALAASAFQAVVISNSMKVYGKNSPYKLLGALPKGTTVTVTAYSGKAALISYNGRTGLARVSDLSPVDSAVQTTENRPVPTAAPQTENDDLSNARPVVTNRATRIYKRPSTSSSYVSVKAGTRLNLLAASGKVARVEMNGVVGYTMLNHLADPGAAAAVPTAEPTATPEPTAAPQTAEVVQYGDTPVMTTRATRVYAKPTTASAYVSVDAGTQMSLRAVKGNCAMVVRDGRTGFVAKTALTTEIKADPTPTPTPAPTQAPASQPDFSGSNEEIIYRFLTREMGYNNAAACGVMANIKYESGYKATSGGDSGTSYGIVQWHGSRKTRLINWCQKNGYDYTTLKGQLYFLEYELKTYYPSVHNKLKAVSNTEQGAYDAGYDFCYRYEAPSNRASRAATRGNYAKTTLWVRYKA